MKDAAKGFGTAKTVIATANDCVSFVFGPDHTTGMKFTLDQWNEIVQFVESQLAPVVEETPSWVDWSRIDEKYNFVAVDEDRTVWVYNAKPYIIASEEIWVCGKEGEFSRLLVLPPANIDWTQSLIKRPIQTPKHVNCRCHI